jgi:hypothetical protein
MLSSAVPSIVCCASTLTGTVFVCMQDRDGDEDDQQFALSRFVPMLQEVLEDASGWLSLPEPAGMRHAPVLARRFCLEAKLPLRHSLSQHHIDVQHFKKFAVRALHAACLKVSTAVWACSNGAVAVAISYCLQLWASCQPTSTPTCGRPRARAPPACPAVQTARPRQAGHRCVGERGSAEPARAGLSFCLLPLDFVGRKHHPCPATLRSTRWVPFSAAVNYPDFS